MGEINLPKFTLNNWFSWISKIWGNQAFYSFTGCYALSGTSTKSRSICKLCLGILALLWTVSLLGGSLWSMYSIGYDLSRLPQASTIDDFNNTFDTYATVSIVVRSLVGLCEKIKFHFYFSYASFPPWQSRPYHWVPGNGANTSVLKSTKEKTKTDVVFWIIFSSVAKKIHPFSWRISKFLTMRKSQFCTTFQFCHCTQCTSSQNSICFTNFFPLWIAGQGQPRGNFAKFVTPRFPPLKLHVPKAIQMLEK